MPIQRCRKTVTGGESSSVSECAATLWNISAWRHGLLASTTCTVLTLGWEPGVSLDSRPRSHICMDREADRGKTGSAKY